MGVKKSVEPLEDENDVVSDDKKMAKTLNEYCSTGFTQELMTDITDLKQIDTGKQMSEVVDLSVKEVLKKVEATDPEKLPGNDNIHSAVLKKKKT